MPRKPLPPYIIPPDKPAHGPHWILTAVSWLILAGAAGAIYWIVS